MTSARHLSTSTSSSGEKTCTDIAFHVKGKIILDIATKQPVESCHRELTHSKLPGFRRRRRLSGRRRGTSVSLCSGRSTPGAAAGDCGTSTELSLQARIKISDRPVRCLVYAVQRDAGPVIVSCAGCQTDSEAMLRWTRLDNDVSSLTPMAQLGVLIR